jgi:competence protein ComEC
MTHIIAISGFNIAILVGIVVWLGQPLMGRRAVFWFTLLVVALYSVLVGAGSSVLRAAVMGLLLMISLRFLGRRTFALAPLIVAGFVMTLAHPDALWDIGFQLSFAATLGILLYVSPASEWMHRQLAPRLGREATRQTMRIVSDLVIVTLAAQLLVLPLLVYHFESLSPISPLANLLILPVQPGVMTFGGLATLTGMVYAPVGQAIGWVAWLFLAYTTGMVSLLADIPWASVPVRLSPAVLLSYYVLVFCVTWLAYQRKERREVVIGYLRENIGAGAVLAAGGIVAILAVLWAFSLPDGNLRVAFLDVGQGDAILIQTPGGRQLLVDGGPQPALLAERVSEQMPFWDREVDLVVATHPDNDHVAGLPAIFERFRVDMLLTNGELLDVTPAYRVLLVEAQADGAEIHEAVIGERLDLGDGVMIEVLHPGEERNLENRNENSVSLRLTYGDFSLLLTGDSAEEAERAMVASGLALRALVFKAGHHGSNTSSNDFFLAAVRPQIVIVSAGIDNRYGHPHPEVLERAAAVGAQILRTDELGTIEVITDGREMWWTAED